MNKEHYNQIIDWTVQQEQLEDKRNTLEAARLIFKNMGIPLPNGTMEEAAKILATNDYMGWRKCTAKEAQTCANDGTATMAVKENEIYIVKAEPDGKDEVATAHCADGDTVSIPSQLAGQEDVQFYSYSAATTIAVKYRPRLFNVLYNHYLINDLDVHSTDEQEGFDFLTCSLADILNTMGIAVLNNGADGNPVYNFYDDWYIYSVQTDDEYVYGLYKMREQEYEPNDNNHDNDDPGITISFIKFNANLLMKCISDPDDQQNQLELCRNINYVTSDNDSPKHHAALQAYFADANNHGAYLIAEQYLQFIGHFAENGYINTPNNYKELKSGHRVKKAVAVLNEKAGYAVVTDDKIHIASPFALTEYEKYAILMTHTANVNFNSFAAEVVFHARALVDAYSIFPSYYKRAIRADMAIGEEYEVAGIGVFDDYYNLNSTLVKEQVTIHGYR